MDRNKESAFHGDTPVLFNNKENCCGCSACFAVCPAQAIVMEADEEGFLYLRIIAKKCIRCTRCLAVCSFKADQREKGFLHTPV